MTSPMAILTDTTLCIGCEKCVTACKQDNNLGPDLPRRWKKRIDDLSSTRFTAIVRVSGNHFVRQHCRHCIDPACVSACLVGAMKKTPEGPVIYDAERCMGCRYCMMACPYCIPRYDWDKPVPYVRKCDMCHDLIQQGKAPACVEACPEKATIFGTRKEMLAEAHRRIDQNPGRYLNSVFGETEIGGTSVLYISSVPLGFLSFKPDMGPKPLPERTWAALCKVPPLAGGVAFVMAGTWWLIGRRMKLADQDPDQKTSSAQQTPTPEQEEENKA